MEAYLDFEKPIISLETKLQDLRELAKQEGVDFSEEISILDRKVSKMIDEIYAGLTPWQRVQLSRHPNRPYTPDYLQILFPSFMELHGDRLFSDDPALIGGVAMWPPAIPIDSDIPAPSIPEKQQTPIMILGHQKGRTTKHKLERNFGMARPEGYRKAMRLMQLAERCHMPILTFIDTPGAYPGPDAEERGQAQAIAESLQMMAGLKVPVIAVIIGEGGSGGALALGVANKVLMQEFSTYSVISPESCASILWSDSGLAERASEKLRMYPNELLKLGTIDAIIPEPKGGAHRNWYEASTLLRKVLMDEFEPLMELARSHPEKIADDRIAKFRAMGNRAIDHIPPEPRSMERKTT